MGWLAGWALRTGVRKGVVGGSGPWLVIAVAAGLLKLANRDSKGKAIGIELKPGERYSVVCSDEPIRR